MRRPINLIGDRIMATPTPEKLLEFIKEKNVKWVDLQFRDIPGDAIDMWIELKSEEYKQNSIRPTPFEFYQYFDI